MKYTCHIRTRDYKEWHYVSHDTPSTVIEHSFPDLIIETPVAYKLFQDDVFEHDSETNKSTLVFSNVRTQKNIPGILLLENNRTYGRTENKKRLYYKCKPNDSKLPYFLVPYDMPMGFQKNFKNKYVTFSFHHWNDKHPCGILSQNIGDTYDLPSFNEYQLYCKNLHKSITTSIAKSKELLKIHSMDSYRKTILSSPDQYGTILNYEKRKDIFTVDPRGCLDRDDAISIITRDKGDITEHIVSVYIANVWVWLEAMDLWGEIGSRVSTIYFPEMKRPMLPTVIGEQLCSLDQEHSRFAFVMEFSVVEHPKKGIYIQYLDGLKPALSQCTIKVAHNFDYEERNLLKYKPYLDLQTLTRKMDKNVVDSHHVIAYWMTQMNFYVAKHMKYEKMGIFRAVKSKVETTTITQSTEIPVAETLPGFIRLWEQQLSGKYVCIARDGTTEKFDELKHEVLGMDQYVHFTSPIRRMVDLLNQILWVRYHLKPTSLRENVVQFYDTQVDNIDELNRQMKTIRRIQGDAHILHKVTNEPNILEKTYEAIVLTQEDKPALYIEKLEWMTHAYLSQSYRKYDRIQCKLYVFEKEEQMRKKIRIQEIVDTK